MSLPHEPVDPNGLTQPIPVVPVPPPPRPRSDPSGATTRATIVRPPPRAAAATGTTTVVPPPYAHRFGSIPLYLAARFAAFAIDIFAIGFVLATFGFHATDVGYFVVAGHDATGFATLASIALGVAVLVAFLSEAIFGTTLGKLVFALHVRRGDGRHAGAARVLVRYFMRPFDLMIIGPLLALVTPRHQRLGDLLGGTVVARSRIGAFAVVLGLLALGGIGYAQIAFGGGLTSAIGVAAETSDFAPGLVANATRLFGVPAVPPPERIAPAGGSANDAGPSPAPIPSAAIQ